jgi:hypothetical protein
MQQHLGEDSFAAEYNSHHQSHEDGLHDLVFKNAFSSRGIPLPGGALHGRTMFLNICTFKQKRWSKFSSNKKVGPKGQLKLQHCSQVKISQIWYSNWRTSLSIKPTFKISSQNHIWSTVYFILFSNQPRIQQLINTKCSKFGSFRISEVKKISQFWGTNYI